LKQYKCKNKHVVIIPKTIDVDLLHGSILEFILLLTFILFENIGGDDLFIFSFIKYNNATLINDGENISSHSSYDNIAKKENGKMDTTIYNKRFVENANKEKEYAVENIDIIPILDNCKEENNNHPINTRINNNVIIIKPSIILLFF